MSNYKPIAIIGYGCIFPPDGMDVEKFWDNVVSGKSGISDISKTHWKKELYFSEDKSIEDKTYCKLGGLLDDYEFPYSRLEKMGVSESQVSKLNRTQKMTLDTILQAVKSSGLELGSFDTERTGFYLGNMLGDVNLPNYTLKNRIDEIAAYMGEVPEYSQMSDKEKNHIISELKKEMDKRFGKIDKSDINISQSALLGAIKNLLNIKGVSLLVDGACSGSGLVVDEAIKNIHSGKIDTCITSAVLGNMVVTGNIGFAKIGGISGKGSYPLDHRASGLIPGEGAGTIILKDLSKAIKDGNKIYGVIRATGVASDGKGQSIYAPSSKGQVHAMRKSIERVGLKPSDIDYIETHATGTLVGDKIEIATLTEFFSDCDMSGKKVAIGSVKSQIGHSFSAAGMANMMKVIEGINRKMLPPTHNFEEAPNGVDLEKGHLYVNTKLTEWQVKDSDTPRRAMVNAFGFGGINGNILIEEYIPAYHKNLVSDKENFDNIDISIVGIGCYDSHGINKEEWWHNVKNGIDEPSDIPESKWNKVVIDLYGKNNKGYYIDKFKFPCVKFKIPPKVLSQIDRSQQLALLVAGEAIEDYGKDRILEYETGVFVGSMLVLETAHMTDLRIRHLEYIDALKNIDEYEKLSNDAKAKIENSITTNIRKYIAKVEEDTLPGYMDNVITGRISNFFNIKGTNAVYDTDAMSFITAMDQAVMSLARGENKLAVVGGVHANMLPEMFDIFRIYESVNEKDKLGILQMADSVPAEGAVFFVIKNTSEVTENDHVYARITDLSYKSKVEINREETICSKNGKKPFYFGANEGFKLLYNIMRLNEDKNVTGIIRRTAGSFYGGGFEYRVIGKDAIVDKEMTKACKDAAVGKVAADTFEDEIRTRYYFGDTEAQMLASKGFEEAPENIGQYRYRMAIVYKTEDELKQKLEFINKLNK